MCGIVGWISWSGNADAAVVTRMRDTLVHRGPDDAGTWMSDDRRVCLGHRRLSIIDLSSAGHQPMLWNQGSRSITFNGEIYNFAELRSELKQQGYAFRTQTDTEVLLAAYDRWGASFVSHLDGMFAFALYDSQLSKVLLVRDRAGEKPLYTYANPNGLLFASEVKALLEHPFVSRTIDSVAIDRYFAYGYVSPERGLIKGTAQLPPAHVMEVDVRDGARQSSRYWNLPVQATRTLDLREAVDRTEQLLEQSVRHQLVADVPVTILLSGGLDSSLVTALAARHKTKLKTFTVRFGRTSGLDEGGHAARVANHFGTDHHEVEADEPDPDVLFTLAKQFDEPNGDSAIVSSYLLARAVRQEATVALGGDGGDELFGGYPFHSDIQRTANIGKRVPRLVRNAIRAAAMHGVPQGVRGRNFAIAAASDITEGIAHATAYWDPAARCALIRDWRDVEARSVESPENWRTSLSQNSGSPLRRVLETDFHSNLAHQYLSKVDRTGMLVSLENRTPMLDRALVEFAFRDLPDHLKATATDRKIVLRHLAGRVLPPSFDSRRKQGFGIPLDHWMKGRWGPLVKDIVLSADPTLFRPATVRKIVDGQDRGRSNSRMLFSLLMFELWRREYRVNA